MIIAYVNHYMKTNVETMKGSDENVVPIDPSMPDLGLNDQLYLFFQKNWKWLILGVIFTIVSILAYYGLDAYQRSQVVILQDSYQSTRQDPSSLLDFAEKNQGNSLSGLAFLTLADQAYSDGDYNLAINHYLYAVKNLLVPIFRNRAQLGLAMSQIGADKIVEGKEALQILLRDLDAASNFRAKAGYNLIILLMSEGNKEQASLIFNEMKVYAGKSSLDQTLWFNRAKSLLN